MNNQQGFVKAKPSSFNPKPTNQGSPKNAVLTPVQATSSTPSNNTTSSTSKPRSTTAIPSNTSPVTNVSYPPTTSRATFSSSKNNNVTSSKAMTTQNEQPEYIDFGCFVVSEGVKGFLGSFPGSSIKFKVFRFFPRKKRIDIYEEGEKQTELEISKIAHINLDPVNHLSALVNFTHTSHPWIVNGQGEEDMQVLVNVLRGQIDDVNHPLYTQFYFKRRSMEIKRGPVTIPKKSGLFSSSEKRELVLLSESLLIWKNAKHEVPYEMIEMNIEVKITPRGNNEIQLQAKQFFVTFQFQSTEERESWLAEFRNMPICPSF